MRAQRSAPAWVLLLVVAAPLAALGAQAAPAPAAEVAPPTDCRTWLGREEEFEEYLRTVEPLHLVEIGIGVTKPLRADLPPGGPFGAFAWKAIRPGILYGYYESYLSEVAAYRLDRLLELGMVPVTVERSVGSQRGAAAMWVTPAKTFTELGGIPEPPPEHYAWWTIQAVRAKMFDNLIANIDPNQGNWLVDPEWNLVLIDHSRAFTSTKRLVHELTRVDGDLWERMLRLDEAALDRALGSLLTKRQIRAILKRRDRMAAVLEELVAEKGEREAVIRYTGPRQ